METISKDIQLKFSDMIWANVDGKLGYITIEQLYSLISKRMINIGSSGDLPDNVELREDGN